MKNLFKYLHIRHKDQQAGLDPVPVHQPKVVPYQVCPLCKGTGKVYYPFEVSTAINESDTCSVCKGAKVIPMHEVEEQVCSFPTFK